jgi:hypothetical protein
MSLESKIIIIIIIIINNNNSNYYYYYIYLHRSPTTISSNRHPHVDYLSHVSKGCELQVTGRNDLSL